jgi:hypothetical protein
MRGLRLPALRLKRPPISGAGAFGKSCQWSKAPIAGMPAMAEPEPGMPVTNRAHHHPMVRDAIAPSVDVPAGAASPADFSMGTGAAFRFAIGRAC